MAGQSKLKIVGTHSVKDGFALAIHGEKVAYEGTLKGAVSAARELIGAFVVTSHKNKAELDAMLARQQKGAPLA